MTTQTKALVRIETRQGEQIYTGEVAVRCRIHPDFIDRMVRLGLCEPVHWDDRHREWVFEPDVVPRIRKILRLRRDLGINYAGIGVVLDLLWRIENLEARLKTLQAGR